MKGLIFLYLFSMSCLPNIKRHIVLNDGVRLRSHPELLASNVIGSVNTAEEVELLDFVTLEEHTWAHIKTQTNQKGWVLKNFVGPRGDRKISEFLKKSVRKKLSDLDGVQAEEFIEKLHLFKGDKEKVLEYAKKNNISQEALGFIFLSQRNKQGLSFIVNSLKNKPDQKLFFAIQSIASENIIKNDYISIHKWYSENFEQLILDDFALVRIFDQVY